jgi:hypothetical protein
VLVSRLNDANPLKPQACVGKKEKAEKTIKIGVHGFASN